MPTLRGQQTILRAMTKQDLAHLHRWLNDPDIMQWWDGRDHKASFDRVEARFRKSIENSDRDTIRFMIEVDRDGAARPIGMIQFGRVQPRAKNTQIDVLIGEPEFRDAGYGTDALRAALKHIFEDLKAHRAWHTMQASNARAQKSAEKIGFKQEGVLREHDQLEGKYVDVVVYGMLASEWRALNG